MRCIQCGANLLGDSISSPAEFAQRYAGHDAVVYGRAWAAIFILGYLAIAFICVPEFAENRPLLLIGVVLLGAVGRIVGKAVAKHHNHGL